MLDILLVVTLLAPPPSGMALEGRTIYRAHCQSCHGATGNGQGPVADQLADPPRDLTRGEYRWRSTPSGTLPTDQDLARTIGDGVAGTWMAGWKDRLSPHELRAVTAYVTTLSPRFAEEPRGEPIAIPEPPPATPESIAAGKKAYLAMRCNTCHGEDGKGDGQASATLKDNDGRSMRAYDFTSGFYKAGSSLKAVYRTYMTGLDGTPMPSYFESVPPKDRWPLVHYTRSLGQSRGGFGWLFDPLEETR